MAGVDVLRWVKKPRTGGLDCSEITPGIYQGAKPPKGEAVALAGFHVLVLCAKEYQPKPASFPGLQTLVSVPLEDDEYAGEETRLMAERAGAMLAGRWLRGENLLITCQMGLNRSGLVTGFTLRAAFPDVPPERILRQIRMKRRDALFNETFAKWVAGR
jgi:protein-tyrosine phosphatase